MPRLTAFCLRHRVLVASVWLGVIALGVVGSLRLTPLLSTGFSLPGTDSNRVKQILAHDFGDRPGSRFVLIAKGDHAVLRARHAAERRPGTSPADTSTAPTRCRRAPPSSFVESRLTGTRAGAADRPAASDRRAGRAA